MDDFKPRPGTFLPYMEYMEREQQKPQQPATPITLIEILERQVQQALPMPDLQTLSGMNPNRFRNVLKILLDSGYVAIDGPTLQEVVRLTEKGVEAARLARPA